MFWYDGDESIGDSDNGGGVGGDDVYRGRTELVLVSVSDSYSEDEIISVYDSRSSSSSAYTITDYLSTNYCCYGSRLKCLSKEATLVLE